MVADMISKAFKHKMALIISISCKEAARAEGIGAHEMSRFLSANFQALWRHFMACHLCYVIFPNEICR